MVPSTAKDRRSKSKGEIVYISVTERQTLSTLWLMLLMIKTELKKIDQHPILCLLVRFYADPIAER
jgi:hypothetical protein